MFNRNPNWLLDLDSDRPIGFVGPNCLSLQSCVIEGFNILLKSVQQFVSGTTRKGHLGPGKPLILVQSIIK